MYAYPPTHDAEQALLMVYKRATGTDTPAAELANACWTLLGYVLDLGLPVDSVVSAAVLSDPYASLAEALSVIGEPQAKRIGDGTLLKLVPWKVVLPLVLQLLQEILTRK